MLAILHHLYKNIPDVVILPQTMEKQFRNHMSLYSETEMKAHAESLKASLQEEINMVGEFFERYRIHCDNSDDVQGTDKRILESYRQFRHALNEREMQTDVLYAVVKNYEVVCDNTSDISL